MFERLRRMAAPAVSVITAPARVVVSPSGIFSLGFLSATGVDPSIAQFVAVDVETTGLDADRDRVVEIAIVRFLADGRIVDEWTTLVDPRCDVGPTFIHRISNTDVMGAPAFGDVASEVAYRLRGAIAVGHNASFDGRFLGSELRRVSATFAPLPALCTIEVLVIGLLERGDPHKHYEIRRGKRLTIPVFAGTHAQAKQNQFRDVSVIICEAECFKPFIAKVTAESVLLYTPAQRRAARTAPDRSCHRRANSQSLFPF